jgi:hypothetical protein
VLGAVHAYDVTDCVDRRDAIGVNLLCHDARAVDQRQHPYSNNKHEVDFGKFSIGSKRYVSFYFTNFPAYLSHFYLRKGFEVCGILEDVYVAKKRNIHGQPYGFAKFSNVRDVTKLEKALNAVTFGQFRVRASVARFDRAARKLASPGSGGEKKESVVNTVVVTPSEGVKIVTKLGDGVPAAPETGPLKGVRVGKVMVPLGDRQENVNSESTRNKETEIHLTGEADTAKDEGHGVYLRKYRSIPDDVRWASTGVVATVANGELIPMVRRRIADAGLTDVEVLHLGADKVFVRSNTGLEVAPMLESAREFFNLVFTNWAGWEDKATPFQRGA